jgi:hypothetical protein
MKRAVSSTLIVFSLALGVLASSITALSADPNFRGVTILNSKAEIQKGDCYRYEATAVMEASPRSVYEALASPQNVLAPQRTIESPDHRSKIFEYDRIGSGMDPPPGHHAVYRVQHVFDPEHLTMSTRVLNDQPQPDNSQYALSPLRDGSATLVYYRSWRCKPQRRGNNPKNEAELTREFDDGLMFDLGNIERRFQNESATPAPQFRDGRRVYPTPVSTPDRPE